MNVIEENRPEVSCETCAHSRFIRGNSHLCRAQSADVEGEYFCSQWAPFFIAVDSNNPPQAFGALHTCKNCRV